MGPKTGRHQNKTAWVAHKHQDGLQVTDEMADGIGWLDTCCDKCKEIIEWRRKYGKYKLLDKPAKCHACQGRTVKRPYHSLCQPCAIARRLCAKCEKPYALPDEEVERIQREKELRRAVLDLPERYKRSAERKMENGEWLEVAALVEKGQKKRAKLAGGVAAPTATVGSDEELTRKQTPSSSAAKAPAKVPVDDDDSDEIIESDQEE
eukprot:TRINITY_DN9885_c0_g4_i1.p1 TRINITY_DN9885_c0_g4~~TRINITY_DN9885_c0_g4_i1.p1  ORF type:complete len:243 (+),score=60.14 TRINITY_DN9885_c0_g4_i1:110-730(+)